MSALLMLLFSFAAAAPALAPISAFERFLLPKKGDSRLRNRYAVDRLHPLRNVTFFAGQEARVRVRTTYLNTESSSNITAFLRNVHNAKIPLSRYGNTSMFPAFNISGGLRFRVIAAYESRTVTSGSPVPCQYATDVWTESWSLSARVLAWGKQLSFSAYSSFIVPPFTWKMCYRDLNAYNRTAGSLNTAAKWTEFFNDPFPKPFLEPRYLYTSSATMLAGDYAAIKIVVNGRDAYHSYNGKPFDAHDHFMSGSNLARGDTVKLVPAGYPCTYEKSTSTADLGHNVHTALATTTAQYCGTNYIRATSGTWVNLGCVYEGSVEDGVAFTGSSRNNPWASHSGAVTPGGAVPSGVPLLAYLRLPAAGSYDVCFSPRAYRLALLNVSVTPASKRLVNAVPVWFKAYRADASVCPTNDVEVPVTTCKPRTSSFNVLAATIAAHGMAHYPSGIVPGSWGHIRFTGSGLSSFPATSWEYSTPREYYQTVGGDQFRLVPEEHFTQSTVTDVGQLFANSAGTRFKTARDGLNRVDATWNTLTGDLTVGQGQGGFIQRQLAAPQQGTPLAAAGCWRTADNFGGLYGMYNGAPGSQCCSVDASGSCVSAACSMSDAGETGVISSGDLGDNPRLPYSPWSLDSAGASETYAYIRFVPGHWRVCYRKAGTENWRVIPNGASGDVHLRTLGRTNYTYSINDTRADTLGYFTVRSTSADLSLLPSTYYTASVPDALVRGSAFKIVPYTASCQRYNPGSRMSFDNPGTAECSIAECGSSASCAACQGAADEGVLPRRDVIYHAQIPAAFTSLTAYYRVCFRNQLSNWYQLTFPGFRSHLYSTTKDKFNPRLRHRIYYTLEDRHAGTWGKLVFQREAYGSPLLRPSSDPAGDVVRLVPNVTINGLQTTCGVTWQTSASTYPPHRAQEFNPTYTTVALGIWCASGSAAAGCASAKIAPTDTSGAIGTYPYVDLDSTDDSVAVSDTDGTVAFMQLPPATTTAGRSYRVCYRQGLNNWIEAIPKDHFSPRYLSTVTAATYTLSQRDSQLYAGMYTYFTVTAPTSLQINRFTDLFKLVLGTSGCDRPAAGNLASANSYSAQVRYSFTRGGAVAVDGSSDAAALAASQPTLVTTMRYYVTLPTQNVTARTVTSYRACFMPRVSGSDTTTNWRELGTVAITTLGINFDVTSQPVQSGTTQLRIVSTSHQLNTTKGGDQLKVVADGSPCSGGTLPDGIASSSALQDHIQLDTAGKQEGVVDLGPANSPQSFLATANVTMPASGARFRVCYKPFGYLWLTLEPVFPSQQTFKLDARLGLPVVYNGLNYMTISSAAQPHTPGGSSSSSYGPGVPYTSAVVAGYSLYDGSLTHLTITGVTSAAIMMTGDRFKFVPVALEKSQGVFEPLESVNCASSGIEGNVTVTGTSAAYIAANLPTTAGRYLFCYKLFMNETWLQLENTNFVVGNPFYVIQSQLWFKVDAITNRVRVDDLFNSLGTSFGGLISTDLVYITAYNGLCGVTADVRGVPVATAPAFLNVSDLNGTAVSRRTTVVQPWITTTFFLSAVGPFKVCVKRTQDLDTYASDTGPYLRLGWYQAINSDTDTGLNSGYYAPVMATAVSVDECPPFNTTNRMRTGKAFTMTARILDSTGKQLSAGVGTAAYLVSANGAFPMTNSLGQCRPERAALYGWSDANLRQFTIDGSVDFSLVPTGSCPTGGCALSFVSTGLTTSRVCTFDVQPTIVATLRATSTVTECIPNEPCPVRVAAFHTDGDLAHTATDSISYATSLAGLALSVRNTLSSSVTGGSSGGVGQLTAGFVSLELTFTVADAAAFATDATVTIIFTSSTGASTTIVFTVPRPTVVGVHIVDLYPSTDAEAPMRSDAFVDRKQVPSWEPQGDYWGGGFSQVTGNRTVYAAPGYHLVAQQFYTARLRLVTSVRGRVSYLADFTLLPAAQRIVTINLPGAAVTAGNAVLGYTSACRTDDGCATAFTGTALSSVEAKLTFRLKNSLGCSAAAGGCTITFLFGGAPIGVEATSIVTPVRSIATTLAFQCWTAPVYDPAAPQVNRTFLSGTGSTTGCPDTTVERGWVLDVRAVDAFGAVDEYFGGLVVPYLTAPYSASTQTTLSRVFDLSNSSEIAFTAVQATATAGRASFERLTLTQPCTNGCSLELFATYGSGITTVGPIVATSSTHHLGCEVTTQLVRCGSFNDGCGSIAGNFTYSATNATHNTLAAIYTDTVVCFNAFAADSNGRPTRYGSVWVHYSIKAAAGGSIQPTDGSGDIGPRQRYVPMNRGAATFCFAPQASSQTNFEVEFAAQQFESAGHWTRGTTGKCTLGPFTAYTKKVVGGVAITGVSGTGTTPSKVPSAGAELFYTTSPTATKALTVQLSATDYYGRAISATQVHSNDNDVEIVIENCRLDNLNSTCIQGTIESAAGNPLVRAKYDPAMLGALSVFIPSTPTSKIRLGGNSYRVDVSRFCIGCLLSWTLQRPGNANINSSIYFDTVGGVTSGRTMRATLTVHAVVLSDVAATRYVGFKAGTSPYRGHWTKHNKRGDLFTIRTSNVALFNKSCLAAGSGCEPEEYYFMNSVCGAAVGTQTVMTGSAAGEPLQFMVGVGQSGYALNSNLELNCDSDNCKDMSRVRQMADILTTYTVAVSIGLQPLRCVNGTTCTDDATIAPKRTIAAFGTTPADAVANLIAANGQVRTANFILEGLESSGFYPINSSNFNGTSPPTRSGALSVSATTTTTGLFVTPMTDTNYMLVWRGGKRGQLFTFSDTSSNMECPPSVRLKCLSGDGGTCPYTGYERDLTLGEIAVNYTEGVFVGVPIPLTLQVQSADGSRVYGATGTVVISLYSWSGCNNGGTVTIVTTGTLVEGRLTSSVTFSAPCESCVLRAVLTPGSGGDVYSTMLSSPASTIALSKPMTVVQQVPTATHVMITTPAASVPATLTVADVVAVGIKSVARVGNLQIDSPDQMTVTAYIKPGAVAFDQYWYGNGGMLRSSTSAAYATHHMATTTVSGSGTYTVAFTRTCRLGCSVNLYYELPTSKTARVIPLRNQNPSFLFFVFTALRTTLAVGYRARVARAGERFAVSQWHVGSELATVSSNPIEVAGVANGTFTAPNIPSFQIVDATNGDGGRITVATQTFTSSETHVIALSRPCRTCSITIGSATSINMGIVTTATRIRVAPFSFTGQYATRLTNTFELSAVDSQGFVDVLFGGNTDCSLWMPFTCASNVATAPLSFRLGSEMPVGDTLKFTPFTPPSGTGNGTMAAGRATIPVTFASPTRQAEPIFSATHGGRTLVSTTSDRVDVYATASGEAVVKAPGVATAFLPTIVEVVLVKMINNVPYVDAQANNAVSLRYQDCPNRVSSSIDGIAATLFKGALNVSIVFSNPASSLTLCRVYADIGLGSSTCGSSCSSSAAFTISASYGQKWAYAWPTLLDNRGRGALPMYAATGRSQTIAIQLLALGPNGDFSVGTCDDPNTGTVETCDSKVTATGCSPAPTITVGSFNDTGMALVLIEYQPSGTGALYTCPLQVSVSRGSGTLAPGDAAYLTPMVQVCTTATLQVVTNFTETGRLFFTGEEYSVTVAAMTQQKQLCTGDSQDLATLVSFDLVSDLTDALPSIAIGAVNTNLTTFAGYASATATNGLAPRNSVRLVGGAFTFRVMFSNATERYGGRAVRLRFKSTFGTSYSNPIHTVFGAKRLRITPDLPRYAVSNRRLVGPNGSANFAVEAVDGVPPAWVAAGYLPGGPSVVGVESHPASFATFAWLLNPAGTFPFQLDGRANPDGTLTSGRKVYNEISWTGSATTVGVSMVATDSASALLPSTEATLSFQPADHLGLNISAWSTTNALVCVSPPCTLPLPKANDAGTAYKINSGTRFRVTVHMLDTTDTAVMGERESVVEAYLTTTVMSAKIVDGLAPTSTGAVLRRMTEGTAVFDLLLLGTTGNTSSVTIGFRCPAVRPNSVLLAGEINASIANPCRSLAALETLPVTLIDTRPTRSDFFASAVLPFVYTIRVRANSTNLARSRYTAFEADIAARLNALGYDYIDPNNRESVIVSLPCTVNPFLFKTTNDLGSTVCATDPLTSVPQCSVEHKTVSTCPTAVAQCLCTQGTAASRHLHVLLKRFLLQTNNATANATVTQIEVNFRLDRASAFTGSTSDAIIAALTNLTLQTEKMLADSYFVSRYGLDPSSISKRNAVAQLNTVAPPTTAPVTTTFPTSAPPYQTPVPDSAAGQTLRVLVTLCVASFALVVVFA
jgi:hypothetical protein